MSSLADLADDAVVEETPPPPIARMVVAVLALAGLLISVYLTLYKLGYLGFIQCGAGGCEVVQSSQYAYFLGLPVALWGVGAYAALLALALAGVQNAWADDRRLGLVILAVATIGVVFSAYLTYLEAAVIRAWCRWCVVSAVLITLTFFAALVDVRRPRTLAP
ncbi:hypothetical protein BH20GEM3_BH20GEM3_05760 [soil metagenome]